jgi:hypothetical protein
MMAGLLIAQLSLTAQEPTIRCDPPAGSLGRLTRTQKKAFMESQDLFILGRYADALRELRGLLSQVPPDTPAQSAMAERTAEAAIEAGERTYAISLLKPIEERDGGDCPARTLLARAYAEERQSAERDVEISALTELHKQAPQSPAGKLDAFLLEKYGLKGGGAVTIACVLRPWGPHITHLLSEIYDASGGLILHIELDSDDGDQVYFRETHPDLAAKGDRRYSLDAFGPKTLPDGTIDHALIQFYDGAPSYDAVRDRILAIAERTSKPAA